MPRASKKTRDDFVGEITENLGVSSLQDALRTRHPSYRRANVDFGNIALIKKLAMLSTHCGGQVPSHWFWLRIERALDRRLGDGVNGQMVELQPSDVAAAIKDAEADKTRQHASGSSSTMSGHGLAPRDMPSPEPPRRQTDTPTVYRGREGLELTTYSSPRHDVRSNAELARLISNTSVETEKPLPRSVFDDISAEKYPSDSGLGLGLDPEMEKKSRPSGRSAKKVASQNSWVPADTAFHRDTKDMKQQQQLVYGHDEAHSKASAGTPSLGDTPEEDHRYMDDIADQSMARQFAIVAESPEHIHSEGLIESIGSESKEKHQRARELRPSRRLSKQVRSYNLKALADAAFHTQEPKARKPQNRLKGDEQNIKGDKSEPQEDTEKKASANSTSRIASSPILGKRSLASAPEASSPQPAPKKAKPLKNRETRALQDFLPLPKDQSVNRQMIELEELVNLNDCKPYDFPVLVRDPREKGRYEEIKTPEGLREASKYTIKWLMQHRPFSDLIPVVEQSTTTDNEVVHPFVAFLRDSTAKAVDHAIRTMAESLKLAAPRQLTDEERSRISELENTYLADMKEAQDEAQDRFDKGIEGLKLFPNTPSLDSGR